MRNGKPGPGKPGSNHWLASCGIFIATGANPATTTYRSQMQKLITAADLHTLTGALQIALTHARQAEGPIERRECLDLATQINAELSRRFNK